MDPLFVARERSLYQLLTTRTIQNRQREIARLQEESSSGIRVNRPSDDPTSYALARKLDVINDRYEHYQKTIDSARNWVNHTQEALDQLVEFYTEAYERGIRIRNDTFSADERNDYIQRIEFILQNVPDQLNSKFGDEYLFAGSRSTQKPFSSTVDNTATPPQVTVTYHGTPYVADGSRGSRTRHIAPGISLDIALNGQRLWEVHDSTDGTTFTITDALQDLANALYADDDAAIETALGRVQMARDHVISLTAETGNLANRLSIVSDQMRETSLLLEERRSHLEDADLIETLMNLQREQLGLEAALKTTASLIQTTLLDYLR